MGKITGCCFGMIVGCGIVVAALIALAAIGIYWWIVPEARVRWTGAAESAWVEVRGAVDETFEKAPQGSAAQAESGAVPEEAEPIRATGIPPEPETEEFFVVPTADE